MFLVDRLSDEALEPGVVYEPAHEAVSVDAIEHHAGPGPRAASRQQQPQVTERIIAARTLAALRGLYERRGQESRAFLHRVFNVQHEVLLTAAENGAAFRVLCRSGRTREEEEEEEKGGRGSLGHFWFQSLKKLPEKFTLLLRQSHASTGETEIRFHATC